MKTIYFIIFIINTFTYCALSSFYTFDKFNNNQIRYDRQYNDAGFDNIYKLRKPLLIKNNETLINYDNYNKKNKLSRNSQHSRSLPEL